MNSHGWRDAETTWEKPADTRRLIVLGDSFAFGVGVDHGKRFSEGIEERAQGLEVLNLGMNAIGPDQELLVLEHDGLRYGPDVVLCALFLGNDFEDVRRSRNGSWEKPWFRLVAGELELVEPRPSWDIRLRTSCYLGEIAYRLVESWAPSRTSAPDWEGVDSTPLVLALLERMREQSEQALARFAVLVIHARPCSGVDAEPWTRSFLDLLDARGFSIIDTRVELSEETPGGTQFHLTDGHWNVEGHRRAAEQVYAYLLERGWL